MEEHGTLKKLGLYYVFAAHTQPKKKKMEDDEEGRKEGRREGGSDGFAEGSRIYICAQHLVLMIWRDVAVAITSSSIFIYFIVHAWPPRHPTYPSASHLPFFNLSLSLSLDVHTSIMPLLIINFFSIFYFFTRYLNICTFFSKKLKYALFYLRNNLLSYFGQASYPKET